MQGSITILMFSLLLSLGQTAFAASKTKNSLQSMPTDALKPVQNKKICINYDALERLIGTLELELAKAQDAQDKDKANKVTYILDNVRNILSEVTQNEEYVEQAQQLQQDNKVFRIAFSQICEYHDLDKIQKIVSTLAIIAFGLPAIIIAWKGMLMLLQSDMTFP